MLNYHVTSDGGHAMRSGILGSLVPLPEHIRIHICRQTFSLRVVGSQVGINIYPTTMVRLVTGIRINIIHSTTELSLLIISSTLVIYRVMIT